MVSLTKKIFDPEQIKSSNSKNKKVGFKNLKSGADFLFQTILWVYFFFVIKILWDILDI